jgi:transcriptional regulator with XRE-family HTH domain
MTQIGKNIKKIRNVKQLSQQAFAELFNLTRGNISSYEDLRAEPGVEVILKIANYFCIPLADLIEKDLSVNRLLHYNTGLVVEAERLKTACRLVQIPYVPVSCIDDYVQHRSEDAFMQKLPVLTVPGGLKSKSVAIETEDARNLPSGFEFHNGDILIFEPVTRENIHRITDRLGMMADSESLKFGIYKTAGKETVLYLNDWIHYPFDIYSMDTYWLLQASYKQE